MNFVRIDLRADGASLRGTVKGTEISVPVPANAALSRYVGREVIAGIRPEMFRVCSEAEALFKKHRSSKRSVPTPSLTLAMLRIPRT
ncbi:hypothetical protein [Sinorhizobium meliloti]|uniref:hypothetical protein n=1 Tax=Rhizobium meliloti TaxID=382 RepID=UPI001F479453|nr:hypothetical protein [Sinorhizobium meliloti]